MQQINLYRAELKPPKVPFRGLTMLQVLAAVALVLVVSSLVMQQRLKPVKAQLVDAELQLKAADQLVAKLRKENPPPVLDQALVQQLTQRRELLDKTREVVSKLNSGELGSVSGLSDHLAGIARQHVEGTWLTGVSVQRGGAALALQGKTLLPELVPVYLERLSEETSFSGKSFSELKLEILEEGPEAIGFAVSTAGIAAGDDS